MPPKRRTKAGTSTAASAATGKKLAQTVKKMDKQLKEAKKLLKAIRAKKG